MPGSVVQGEEVGCVVCAGAMQRHARPLLLLRLSRSCRGEAHSGDGGPIGCGGVLGPVARVAAVTDDHQLACAARGDDMVVGWGGGSGAAAHRPFHPANHALLPGSAGAPTAEGAQRRVPWRLGGSRAPGRRRRDRQHQQCDEGRHAGKQQRSVGTCRHVKSLSGAGLDANNHHPREVLRATRCGSTWR